MSYAMRTGCARRLVIVTLLVLVLQDMWWFVLAKDKKEVVVNTDRRVGICVTGQLSRLELQLKVKNIVKPLKTYGFRVDIIALLSDAPPRYVNARYMGNASWFRELSEVEKFLANKVDALRVVKYNQAMKPLLDPSYVRLLDNQRTRAKMEFRTTVHINQWALQQECLFNFLELETQNKEQYGFVMRLREDAVFLNPIKLNAFVIEDKVTTCACEVYRGINDKGMLVPRALMHSSLSVSLKEFFLHANREEYLKFAQNAMNPESFAAYSLSRAGVPKRAGVSFCPAPLSILGPTPDDYCIKFLQTGCWDPEIVESRRCMNKADEKKASLEMLTSQK